MVSGTLQSLYNPKPVQNSSLSVHTVTSNSLWEDRHGSHVHLCPNFIEMKESSPLFSCFYKEALCTQQGSQGAIAA